MTFIINPSRVWHIELTFAPVSLFFHTAQTMGETNDVCTY